MKKQKKTTNRSKLSHDLRIRIGTIETPAYHMRMEAGKTPEQVRRLGVARVNLDSAGIPRFVPCLGQPTLGFPRLGADAFAVDASGEKKQGDTPMRQALAIKMVDEAIRAAETGALPGWLWTGLGNTGTNRGCPVWQAGHLQHCLADAAMAADFGIFHGVVFWKDLHVTIERIQFVPGNDQGMWVPLIGGKPVAEHVSLILCGQRLIERGRPTDPTANARSEYFRALADLRHALRNAYPALTLPGSCAPATSPNGNRIYRDYGLDQIFADPVKREAAVEGHPVCLALEVSDIDGTRYLVLPEDLHKAFADKGYTRCDKMQEFHQRHLDGERGFYLIDESRQCCHIVYAKAIYPLHFIAVRRNGDKVFYDGAISGWSNNAGTSLTDLALHLRLSGFIEAICFDNGGDVCLVSRGYQGSDDWPDPNGKGAVVPSSLKRKQWAGVLLYQGETAAGIDIRLDDQGALDSEGVQWFDVSW